MHRITFIGGPKDGCRMSFAEQPRDYFDCLELRPPTFKMEPTVADMGTRHTYALTSVFGVPFYIHSQCHMRADDLFKHLLENYYPTEKK